MTGRLCLLLLLLSTAHGFQMPTLENIGNIFRDLVQTKSESVTKRDAPADPQVERVRRQSFATGDQAYEARSET